LKKKLDFKRLSELARRNPSTPFERDLSVIA